MSGGSNSGCVKYLFLNRPRPALDIKLENNVKRGRSIGSIIAPLDALTSCFVVAAVVVVEHVDANDETTR